LPFRAVSRAGIRFDAEGAKNLLVELDGLTFDPDVIIAETFRRLLVGSENEQEDVTEFWLNVEPITRAEKTLAGSHHRRKPSRERKESNRNRASGSTDILAGADAALAIARPCQANIAVVEATKSRDGEECPPFGFSLHADDPDGPVVLKFGDYSPQAKVK